MALVLDVVQGLEVVLVVVVEVGLILRPDRKIWIEVCTVCSILPLTKDPLFDHVWHCGCKKIVNVWLSTVKLYSGHCVNAINFYLKLNCGLGICFAVVIDKELKCGCLIKKHHRLKLVPAGPLC